MHLTVLADQELAPGEHTAQNAFSVTAFGGWRLGVSAGGAGLLVSWRWLQSRVGSHEVPLGVAHTGGRAHVLIRRACRIAIDVALSKHRPRGERPVGLSEGRDLRVGGELLAAELHARKRQDLKLRVLLVELGHEGVLVGGEASGGGNVNAVNDLALEPAVA